MAEQRTIAFFPDGSYSATRNCVAVGDVLRARGHRVVFLVDESSAGDLEASGFEEVAIPAARRGDDELPPEVFWTELIRETGPLFRKSTLEQLSELIAPTWQTLIDRVMETDESVTEILEDLDPHAVLEDNVICYPALAAGNRPWVRLVSANPAEIKDPAIPPFSSGYPSADRTYWRTFLDEVERTHREMWESFDAVLRVRKAPPLSWHETGPDFIGESPWLNLYVYPAEADYARARPLAPTWHRLDSIVGPPETPWQLPGGLRDGGGGLLYLSLGPLGSADAELLQRVVDVLGPTPHRVIVATGPLGDRLTLHDNMTGEAVPPQSAILQDVDLVITHGGNDTVTEALSNGLPMVVLPLFWDQADNAQRLDETGFGVRLSTFGFRDVELTRAIERLLGDTPTRARLRATADRIQASPGALRAADLVERLAVTGEPVTAAAVATAS